MGIIRVYFAFLFLLVSSFGFAMGSKKGDLVERDSLEALKTRGLRCKVERVKVIKDFGSGGLQQKIYNPRNLWIKTNQEHDMVYFELPPELSNVVGYFGFDVKDLKALSRDFLFFTKNENQMKRELEIKFESGRGKFFTEANYKKKTKLERSIKQTHKVELENCNWL